MGQCGQLRRLHDRRQLPVKFDAKFVRSTYRSSSGTSAVTMRRRENSARANQLPTYQHDTTRPSHSFVPPAHRTVASTQFYGAQAGRRWRRETVVDASSGDGPVASSAASDPAAEAATAAAAAGGGGEQCLKWSTSSEGAQ